MNRTELPLFAALLLVPACGDTSNAGEASSTTASASSSTTTVSTAATTSSGDTATSAGAGGAGTASGGGSGDGGATTGTVGHGGAGEGGAGGAQVEGPTPAECFAFHDEAECFAAGCDRFSFHPKDFTIVDGVCQFDNEVGYCFREDPDGGGSASARAFFRTFDAVGPDVLGFAGQPAYLGWQGCDRDVIETVPECCCWNLNVPECEGITPIPID